MKLLMLGLPAHGKTSYLGALWHVLEGEGERDARIAGLPPDLEYLTEIRRRWLRCESTQRTQGEVSHAVSFDAIIGETSVGVDIPDMSGEVVERAWTNRTWPYAFDQLVIGADACLLFANPEHLREPVWLDDVNAAAELALPQDSAFEPASESQRGDAFDAARCPTDVQLVDILQIASTRRGMRPLPLSVVVSAWDLVSHGTPRTWVDTHLPLLHQ